MSEEVEAFGGRIRLMGPLELLTVHETTALHHGTYVNTAGGRIEVGAWAFFGPDVKLYTGSHDYTKFGYERSHSTYQGRNCDIILREGVWVAGSAVIVGPCDIGAHSVVAAGAVVTGTFPEYALIAGNPGKQIKDVRFPDDPWPPTS